jgi:hypothetical protein
MSILLLLKIKKIELKIKHHLLFVCWRCLDCPKIKFPHIIHLTNQHWMNQRFPYRYGSIPHQNKHYNFLKVFDVFVAAWTSSTFSLGIITFFLRIWWKNNYIFPKIVHLSPFYIIAFDITSSILLANPREP